MLNDDESYKKVTDGDAQESNNWKPANLYIYCDKAIAKVLKNVTPFNCIVLYYIVLHCVELYHIALY